MGLLNESPTTHTPRSPAPTDYEVGNGDLNGEPVVILELRTNSTELTLFLPPDFALPMGEAIVANAKKAASGIRIVKRLPPNLENGHH